MIYYYRFMGQELQLVKIYEEHSTCHWFLCIATNEVIKAHIPRYVLDEVDWSRETHLGKINNLMEFFALELRKKGRA